MKTVQNGKRIVGKKTSGPKLRLSSGTEPVSGSDRVEGGPDVCKISKGLSTSIPPVCTEGFELLAKIDPVATAHRLES